MSIYQLYMQNQTDIKFAKFQKSYGIFGLYQNLKATL